MRKRQFVVELSTTKVEYMADTYARNAIVWLEKNHVYHSKTKHIDVHITF